MTTFNQAKDALFAPLQKNPRATITGDPQSLLETDCFLVLDTDLTNAEKRMIITLIPEELEAETRDKRPFYLSAAVMNHTREQRTLGPVGTRRYDCMGSMLVRILVNLKPPTTYVTNLANRLKFTGNALPSAAMIADCLASDLSLIYSARRFPVTGTAPAPDRNFDVIVGATKYGERGVDRRWWNAIVEIPFEYMQYA